MSMNLENALVRYKGYDRNARLIDRDISLSEGNFINALDRPRRAERLLSCFCTCKNWELRKATRVSSAAKT